MKIFVPCAVLIWLDEKCMSNTYCMREKGHPDEKVKGFPGGHNSINEPPVEACIDAMCYCANMGIEHTHPDPKDLTRVLIKTTFKNWYGVFGTNG
jgi:hypothetical protein